MAGSVKTFACPNCGSNVTVRAAGHTVNVFCDSCNTQIDPNDLTFRKIELYHNEYYAAKAYLPIGAKGKLENKIWEVIGFRTLHDGGFFWREYLLFNPYYGFRFLVEADGDWTLYQKTNDKPDEYLKKIGKNKAKFEEKVNTSRAYINKGAIEINSLYQERLRKIFEDFFDDFQGKKYKLFNVGTAKTAYVLGEFYWRVEIATTANLLDAVAPPDALSLELEDGELSVATGVYIEAKQIQVAFQISEPPPRQKGVGAAQPTAIGKAMPIITKIWFFAFVVYFGLQINYCARPTNQPVLTETLSFNAGQIQTLVSSKFQLTGAPANLEIDLSLPTLENSWFAAEMTLINAKTGENRQFVQELEYYFGADEDGPWTEGSQSTSNALAFIPDGEYYLAIDPSVPEDAKALGKNYAFNIAVVRDVSPGAIAGFFLFGLPLLLFILIPYIYFYVVEGSRWSNSSEGNPYEVNTSGGDDD